MSQKQSKVLSIEKILHHFVKWVLFMITGSMTLIVLLGILFRYVLKAPLPWSEELARYLMAWGVSLGAAVAYREGTHIAVTILMDKLHGLRGKVITWIAQIIVIIFMAIVMFEGFILVFKLSGQTSPAMEIPMAWAYLAIPVGCLLILFEAIIMVLSKNQPPGEKVSEPL